MQKGVTGSCKSKKNTKKGGEEEVRMSYNDCRNDTTVTTTVSIHIKLQVNKYLNYNIYAALCI